MNMHYGRGGEDQKKDDTEHNEQKFPEIRQIAGAARPDCGVKSDIAWGTIDFSNKGSIRDACDVA